MRILITGGAGCLGSNLVEAYLPRGHEILVIDNFATGRREALPDLPGLAVKAGTIADHETVDEAFARFAPTHVIHSAAAQVIAPIFTSELAFGQTATNKRL